MKPGAMMIFITVGICIPATTAVSVGWRTSVREVSPEPLLRLGRLGNPQTAKNEKAIGIGGPGNDITFTLNSFVDGADSYDGAFVAWTAYSSSNGEVVSVTSRTFDNVDALGAYVRWQLRKGTKIKARRPRVNASGERIGERILITRPVKGQDRITRTFTTLIWTDGATYHQISGQSVSIETVLAMEKWIGVKSPGC